MADEPVKPADTPAPQQDPTPSQEPAPEPTPDAEDDFGDFDPDKDGEELYNAIKDIPSPSRGDRKSTREIMENLSRSDNGIAHVFKRSHETYRRRGAELTQRETGLSEREKAIKAQEDAFVARERALREREAATAKAFKDAGFDGIPTPVDPKPGEPSIRDRMKEALAKNDMDAFLDLQAELAEAKAAEKIAAAVDPIRKVNESFQAQQARRAEEDAAIEAKRRVESIVSMQKSAEADGFKWADELKPVVDSIMWPDESVRAKVLNGERIPPARNFEDAFELAKARVVLARQKADATRKSRTVIAQVDAATRIGGGAAGHTISDYPRDPMKRREWVEQARRDGFSEEEIGAKMRSR